MKDKYTPGQDCGCYAYSESECGCDADWNPSEVYELREQLKSERALADRLAEAMQGVMLEERDLPVASCRGFIDFDQAILALEKWKEARSE